ncbi:Gastric intrinsic factor [Trichoplax sp. H2]|nr:Gastric intrinsic factor [Trichoplax sp. H2]|eukprot:RDD45363.1 Gastric intrinsic factor [Trichoplax sp. H2]
MGSEGAETGFISDDNLAKNRTPKHTQTGGPMMQRLKSPFGLKVTWAYCIIMTIITLILLIALATRNDDKFYAEERMVAVQSTQTVTRGISFVLQRQKASGGWASVSLTAQVTLAIRLAGGFNPAMIRLFNNTASIKDYLTKVIQQKYVLHGTTPAPTQQAITGGQLAYVMLALKAMCVNTSKFANINLNQQLALRLKNPNIDFNHQYPYALALLTLCLNNYKNTSNFALFLSELQVQSDGGWYDVDSTSMAIMALHCVGGYQNAVQRAIQYLLKNQNSKTFLFGNEYATAHAIQALLSVNVPITTWNYPEVLQSLFKMRKYDGTFGRVDNTVAVLPSITGSTFLDLKSATCKPPSGAINSSVVTIVYTIRYNCPTLDFGDETPLSISAKAGSPMLTFMKMAAGMSSRFNYTLKYHATFDAYTVETINGISSDSSSKLCYWYLQYDVTKQEVPLGISHFIPKNNDEISFVYRKPQSSSKK